MAELASALSSLAGADFFTVALPVVLAFALVYGLLNKLDLFGDATDRVSAVIALVIAVYVGYHSATVGLGAPMTQAFGSTALVLVTALMGLTGLALLGVTPSGSSRITQAVAAIVGVGLAALVVSIIGVEAIIPGGVSVGAVMIPAVDLVVVGAVVAAAAGVAYPMFGGSGGE